MTIATTKKFIKLGRGARNQRDSFHQQYLDRKDQLREQYIFCRTHKEKRHIQELLVAWVKQMQGEFVEESPDNKRVLQVVTDDKKILKKVAQALRELRKGPQRGQASVPLPPSKFRCPTHTPTKTSSSETRLPDDVLSKMDSPMQIQSKKIVQGMREFRQASKAVHSAISVPSVELHPLSHTSIDDWNFKDEEVSLFQSNPLGVDFMEENILPDNVESETFDYLLSDALDVNEAINSVPDSNEFWELSLDIYSSDDELWPHFDFGTIVES
jgi:hypothetical protein